MRTLKSMERRIMDAKLHFPTYNGKINPSAIMDWVDALTNFFKCGVSLGCFLNTPK